MKKLLFISLFMITALVCNAHDAWDNKIFPVNYPTEYVIASFSTKYANQERLAVQVRATNLNAGEKIVIKYSMSSGASSGQEGTVTLTSTNNVAYLPTYAVGKDYCYTHFKAIENTSKANFSVELTRYR